MKPPPSSSAALGRTSTPPSSKPSCACSTAPAPWPPSPPPPERLPSARTSSRRCHPRYNHPMPRDPQVPQFFRTLRVRNVNQVGVLASVLTVIARHGVSVGDIRTVHQSRTAMVRDIDLLVESLAELDVLVEELERMPETNVLELRDEVLTAHL